MDIGPHQLMFIGNTWQVLLIVVVVLVLFGQGKVADFMGEFGKGIKNFKKGLAEDHDSQQQPATQAKSIEHDGKQAETPISQNTETKA